MNRRSEQPPTKTQPRTILVSTYPEALPATRPKTKQRRGAKQRGAAYAQPWTREDDQFLRKHYPEFGSIHCAQHLGRTKSAVNARAEKLGVRSNRRRKWTAKELAILRTQCGKLTPRRLAGLLKRPEVSVRYKLRAMGLTEAVSRVWSHDEIAYLRAHYGTTGNAELAEELGRTVDAMELKAARLGLSKSTTPVTAHMERSIVKSLGKKDFTEIARELGLSVDRVRRIGLKHGYHARPTSRKWTTSEDDVLRQLFATTTNAAIAERLERTELAVSIRGQMLGLSRPVRIRKRPGTRRLWTLEEEELLKRLFKTTPHRQIAEQLGRTPNAVNRKAYLFGLLKRTRRSMSATEGVEG